MNHQLDQQTLDQIVAQIVKVLDPEKIILFGSYARGEAGPDSDVDIAVIAETNEPPGKRALGIGWPLRDLHLPLEILVYTPHEWDYYGQVHSSFPSIIKDTGRIIYERTRVETPVGAGLGWQGRRRSGGGPSPAGGP